MCSRVWQERSAPRFRALHVRQLVPPPRRHAVRRAARHRQCRVVANHDQPLTRAVEVAHGGGDVQRQRLQRVAPERLGAGLVELGDEVVGPHLDGVHADVGIAALPPREPLLWRHADRLQPRPPNAIKRRLTVHT